MSNLELEKESQALAKELLKKPHYCKMGLETVCIIVDRCRAMGIDPLIGLNGGMHNIAGKIEMSAELMNTLIRKAGHSISRDKKSDNTICILHGKRKDNGDTWTESFSLQDAAVAGLANSPVWKKYPKSMLFARALSLLARQLFPDVIHGCYVADIIDGQYVGGEIYETQKRIENMPVEVKPIYDAQIEPIEDRFIDSDEIIAFEAELAKYPNFLDNFTKWCIDKEKTVADVKYSHYQRMMRSMANFARTQGEAE